MIAYDIVWVCYLDMGERPGWGELVLIKIHRNHLPVPVAALCKPA